MYQLVLDRPAVYNVIDWKKDVPAAMLYGFGAGNIGALCIWLAYYAIYRIRCRIFVLTMSTTHTQDSQTIPGQSDRDLKMQDYEV